MEAMRAPRRRKRRRWAAERGREEREGFEGLMEEEEEEEGEWVRLDDCLWSSFMVVVDDDTREREREI